MAWELDESEYNEVVNETRSVSFEFLDAPPSVYDLIFTSNTTEAINLAAENLSQVPDDGTESVILSSLLEHSSNDLPWRYLLKCQMIRLKIDNDGFIDVGQMERLLADYNEKLLFGRKRIRLIAVSGASNVLGTYNDLTMISYTAHKYGAMLLVDAAQLIAHRSISMTGSGIDFLAFSAHKMYAPFGSGGLILKRDLINFSKSVLAKIKAAGEMNIAGIAAMGKSMVLLQRAGMDLIGDKERALITRALEGLSAITGITLFGINDINSPQFSRKGSVIAFSLKNPWPHKLAHMLAGRGGIGVRFGCHCAHILVKHLVGVTPSLEKFQRILLTLFPKLSLPGIVRISFGIGNSVEDVDRFILTLKSIVTDPAYDHKKVRGLIDEYIRIATLKVYNI